MEYTKFVKLKNEHYCLDDDMERLLKYISGEGSNKKTEKVLKSRGKGISSDAGEAAGQMIAIQKAFGKDDIKRLYHLILSFPDSMRDKEAIRQAAEQVADMFFENFQVYYGIHTSTKNWHIHFAVNAVSYRTGKKWHQNKKELAEMKREICEIVFDI